MFNSLGNDSFEPLCLLIFTVSSCEILMNSGFGELEGVVFFLNDAS